MTHFYNGKITIDKVMTPKLLTKRMKNRIFFKKYYIIIIKIVSDKQNFAGGMLKLKSDACKAHMHRPTCSKRARQRSR